MFVSSYIPLTTHLTFRNSNFEQNTNLHQLSRHKARTAEADRGRVGRAEQGELRLGNSAPRGGPLLELS